MTSEEVYRRACDLMDQMRELEQECDLLEARHDEVVARMRENNAAMERLMWQAMADHAYVDGDDRLC